MLPFKRVLVTGGGGFVGLALTARLRQAGVEVVSIQRGEYVEHKYLAVEAVRADLTDPDFDLTPYCKGVDVIFHTAAKVEMWGPRREFEAVNVEATRRLLTMAQKAGVGRFVYTSSPSVVASDKNLCGVDESQPYPSQYIAEYPRTKALAEKLVLAAHQDSFRTLALRPHLIFGPGDTNLIPTVIERASQGRLPQIGEGKNLSDFCFIDDCVSAHICAAIALQTNKNAGGRAYFITQGEPMLLWEWIREVLNRAHAKPINKKIPFKLAYALAACFEKASKFFPRLGEPRLTRFLVLQMATDHYFSIEAAKRELGFVPQYSMKQALDLTFADIPV